MVVSSLIFLRLVVLDIHRVARIRSIATGATPLAHPFEIRYGKRVTRPIEL
mgnify:FL=1